MLSWNLIYLLFFLYRCIVSVLAQLVVARLTILGDAAQFQHNNLSALERVHTTASDLADPANGPRFIANRLTELIGSIFAKLTFNEPILINIGFQSIAFIGIVYLLRTLEPEIRGKILIMLLLPSFNLWSSIASKESIIVFAAGIFAAKLYRVLKGDSALRFGLLFTFLILMVFKIQYAFGITYIFLLLYTARYVRQPAFWALFWGLVSLVPLYIGKDVLDHYSFEAQRHFLVSTAAGSRGKFFIDQYDIFTKAPYGMFQAFFGPTLSEVARGPLQLMSFAESAIMVAVIVYIFFRGFLRMPAFNLFGAIFTIGWILFATFPFGIINAGSAVRYRTGYFLIVAAVVAMCSSRELFCNWRENVAAHARIARS